MFSILFVWIADRYYKLGKLENVESHRDFSNPFNLNWSKGNCIQPYSSARFASSLSRFTILESELRVQSIPLGWNSHWVFGNLSDAVFLNFLGKYRRLTKGTRIQFESLIGLNGIFTRTEFETSLLGLLSQPIYEKVGLYRLPSDDLVKIRTQVHWVQSTVNVPT